MEDYEDKIDYRINGEPIDLDLFRYRDDTLCNWKYGKEELMKFWQYLNTIHPSIKWDEPVIEENGVTNFLDVLIKRNEDNTFSTAVYRKPSHTDRYLH